MKLRAMYLVVMCALGACAVDSADVAEPATEDVTPTSPDKADKADNDGTSSIIGRCSPRSLGVCANASFGSLCSISPARWCLPSNELPDGSILCGCQSQSTI